MERMSTGMISKPKFSQDQSVRFIGGKGKVKGLNSEPGGWLYMVEMEMGPEPEMGRIGYETTVVLSEVDLLA
jgi:23S rRNA U2552 (ribose-2'-O)-methylase RlmE/FtsJ